MFGYTRTEVVGRPAGSILPEDLREQDELGWIRERLARGENLENHVTRRVRRDGTELDVSLTRTVLRDSQGKAVGSTAVIRDITEQKRTEAELGHALTLAMVGELAAKIAHEVKNPLAGIYAAIQLLARGCEPEDPRRQVFDDVSQEVRRLDETVQELLNFARPTPPKPRATDLRSFVRDLLESLRHQPQLAAHAVEVDIEEELVVSCDTRLLGQVFSNLVLNAGQAMERPGRIRIVARRDGERSRVEVRDTGPGIDAERLESIFEPFFTTRARGTGLGLCIARKNVEAHGGLLAARSEPGAGAVFEFTLPLAEGPG
jgi:PAS domain S-box-containing protein